MAEQPPSGSVRREGVSVQHRDLGRLPLVGREETLTVSGSVISRGNHTTGQTCAACGRTLVKAEDFLAVCVCCGLPICKAPECQVFCVEETCRQAVCPRNRRSIGEDQDAKPQYLCLPHYEEWEKERMIIGIVAVLVIVAAAMAAFFWLG